MSKLVLACLLAASCSAQVYSIKDDPSIIPPKVLYKEEPKYSDAAKEAKAQGAVVLRLEVSEKGLPEKIAVVTGLHPDLDQNAVEAVSHWRFDPAVKDGKPVRVKAQIEINFRLT